MRRPCYYSDRKTNKGRFPQHQCKIKPLNKIVHSNMCYRIHRGQGRATWQLEFHQIPTQFTQIDYFGLTVKRYFKKKKDIFQLQTLQKNPLPA